MQAAITLIDPEPPHIEEIRPVTRRMRKRLKGYYQHSQRLQFYIIGLGVVALVVGGIAGHAVSVIVGATLCLIGGFFIFQPLNVATAPEVDEVARSDFASIQTHALARSQLEAADLVHEEPCCFRNGLSSLPETGSAFTGEKRGKDLKIRWTPHELNVVNFGREQLFVYSCVLDLTTGNATYEKTREFLYRDIVSVDTDADTITVKVKDPELRMYWQQRGARVVGKTLQVDSRVVLSLHLASGERVIIADWDGYSSVGLQPDEVGVNTLAAGRLRRLVRELKQHGPRQIAPPRIVRHTRDSLR